VILDQILARKREDVARAKKARPLSAPPRRARPHAFSASLAAPGVGMICEIKKASPSRGPIDLGLDVAKRAGEYTTAGARGISVLTEEHFFAGSLTDLETAARVTTTPLLRKDFIVDPYQILETAHSSAAALLLIVAALEPSALKEYLAQAQELGLDALVEVHTEAELEVALASNATLVGVNNRNLDTLVVDLGVSRRLIPRIRPPRIAVAESGFSTPQEVAELSGLGAKAFLVGEALMFHGQPGAKIQELLSLVDQPTVS
jgi:indole-3-glycerol phosphate synthase